MNFSANNLAASQRFVSLFGLLAFVCSAVAAPVKLAIVSTSPVVSNPAAVLTASLSKNPAVELLEREALDKIVRERGLAANQITNLLAASRILGAEGVLFLEAAGPRTNQTLRLRLVSSKEGAVLYSSESGIALENPERWAETISTQIGRMLPKIGADRSKVVPITVLNLRSPSASSASELLDRELTSLLLSRLARETNLLLLERRKLLDVALEKDLAASTEQFWAGAYLLDGAVNKEGFRADQTTVSVRLVAPNKSVTEIESSGQRTNLAAIVETIVARTLDALKVSKSVQWDPAREAREHAEEANWALRWKMYPEAQAAADSAWALGLQTRPVAVTRSLAYGRDHAQSDPLWGSGGLFHLASASHPPRPERTDTVMRAVAILNDLLTRDPTAVADNDVNSAAAEALEVSGKLLHAYYLLAETREGRETQLADWRKLCRNIEAIALKNPTVRDPFVNPAGLKKREYELEYGLFRTNIFAIAATYTGIFNEKPEDAILLYRDLVQERGFPFIREPFVKFIRGLETPKPTAGWKWDDRKRDAAVWDEFVQKLSASTNVFIQLEGRLFDLRAELNWQRFKQKRAKLLDFIDQNWIELSERKDFLLLTDVISISYRVEGNWVEAENKEAERLEIDGLQFLADHGMSINRNGRVFVAKNRPAQPAPSPTAWPTFTPIAHGSSLNSQFIELAPYGRGTPHRLLQSPVFREGKLWIRMVGGKPEIFAIDLKTKWRETIALPTNYFALQWGAILKANFLQDADRINKSFEVRSNDLFVVEGTAVYRHRISGDRWISSTIPVKDPDIYQVNGKLFLSGADSIYELDDGGGARLLASARRKPAVSVLDDLETFDYAPLSSGPDSTVRAFIRGNAYAWNGQTWKPVTQFTNLDCRVRDDGAFFTTLNSPPFVELHSLPAKENVSRYLAVGAYSKTDPALFRGETNQWVVGADNLRGGHFFIGDIPTVFCQAERPENKGALRWKLLLFPPSAKQPVDIALDFAEQPANGLSEMFYQGFKQPWALNTPDGVVLGHAKLPGFWVIPKADLDGAVAQAMRVAEGNVQTSSAK
jgi:hypothetical protein